MINRALASITACFQGTGRDPEIFRIWERAGWHLTPVHFYQPIPDTRRLAGRLDSQLKTPGFDLREDDQLALLQRIEEYRDEYGALQKKPGLPGTFFLDNDAYTGIDPFVYYGLIRHLKPRRVIEIGSGHSTLLAAQALGRGPEGYAFTVIDPYARNFVKEFFGPSHSERRLVLKPAEDIDPATFDALESNDILFVDSSHVAYATSDVVFLVLEVIPRLKPGVWVHFHDIFIPYDYPREWILEDHRFWNEQYLLAAYLAKGMRGEVAFANHYMAQRHPERIRKAFPEALGWWGVSFWFRTT